MVLNCAVRILLTVAAKVDLDIDRIDVCTAFLHGELEEEISTCHSEGFAEKTKEERFAN